MNYNVLTYLVYLGLMVFLIIHVGKLFHRNGRLFIISLMNGDVTTADYLNNLLLIAYYLFNIGYAFIKLRNWQTITTMDMMIGSIAGNMSTLIFILAVTHYLNMLMIWLLSGMKKHFFTHKTL